MDPKPIIGFAIVLLAIGALLYRNFVWDKKVAARRQKIDDDK